MKLKQKAFPSKYDYVTSINKHQEILAHLKLSNIFRRSMNSIWPSYYKNHSDNS